ncbi:MFS general substrate transporter [Melanogaster broomeanus]|nr:MFS general substrate transporter [Melanogaster broomeanus]
MTNAMTKAASDTPPRDELESGRSSEGQHKRTIAPTLTAEQETKLWRKVDLRIIPIMTFMFLFSFTDRAAIGLAAIDGVLTQLDLTGNKFNTVLSMYFVTFCVFEVPANLVIQVIRPSRQAYDIPRFHHLTQTQDGFQGSWLAMGFVKTYHQLLAMRVCLGAVEAGLYPGVAYYLSSWYPKYKLQYRLALFAGTSSLAGGFAGFLGYAITHMNGVGDLETWSWIFIFDGIGTILAGIIAAFLMVDYPSTAKFLTDGERILVIEQIESGTPQNNDHSAAQQVWAAFTDWQVWTLCAIFFTIASPGYALSYFLPTIINGFGYSAAISQVLTIPLYVLSSQWEMQLFGEWLANNLGAPYKRATALALQLTIGNMSGAIASTIFPVSGRAPILNQRRSLVLLEIIFISVGLIGIPIAAFAYKRINAARDREELLQKQQGEKVQHKEGGGKRIGDRELSFRYTI